MDVLERAIRTRASLIAQLQRVEQFIENYKKFSGELFRSTPTRGNPKKEMVCSVAREIIAEKGSPIPCFDLMAALNARGINIRGKKPEAVLIAMLWRQKEHIVRIRGYGYWLAESPWPGFGHNPNHSPTPERTTHEQR